MFGRIRTELRELAGRFDPSLVDAATARRLLDDVIAIENIAAAVKASLATRVADTGLWRDGGDRTAAVELARRTGVSINDAHTTLETGRRLVSLPATSEAARRGELSARQTAAIADAASVDPDAESHLLDQAKSVSLQELRAQCARAKARVVDMEERRRRIHAARHVRSWVDAEGAGHLHYRDNPERVAAVMARVNAERDHRHDAAVRAGCPEALEAHAADALHEMVGGAVDAATPGRPRPHAKVLVRVDFPTLLRGYPIGDEVCEIAGYGPVAVSAVRELLESGSAFLAGIVTKGEAVVGVAHFGRRPLAKQQSALEWLYPTCAAEGCNARAFLENDHREDWARTGITVIDLLDRLCSHHHRLKTVEGWALVEGRGPRAFVSPDDRRHPRHARLAHGPPAAA